MVFVSDHICMADMAGVKNEREVTELEHDDEIPDDLRCESFDIATLIVSLREEFVSNMQMIFMTERYGGMERQETVSLLSI